jgi:hypothetical protein
MPIRTRQLIIDEDLSLQGFRLLDLRSLVLAEREGGTLPEAGEILYADEHVQVRELRVNDRLVAGAADDAAVLFRGVPLRIDTRSSEWDYNGAGNVATITDFVDGTPVSITTFAYDTVNRIASKAVQTNAGTATETYAYADDESDALVAVTRTVVL